MLIPFQTIFEGDVSKQVPDTVAHCMLAVRKKGKDTRDAWNICRAAGHKNKTLKGGYSRDEKLKPSVTQTQKGRRASERHRHEPDAHKKRAEFSKDFRKIEPAVVRRG